MSNPVPRERIAPLRLAPETISLHKLAQVGCYVGICTVKALLGSFLEEPRQERAVRLPSAIPPKITTLQTPNDQI